MNYWLHIHNMEPEHFVELARLAEEAGFEGVVGDDHWFMPAASGDHDPNERAPLPMDYLQCDALIAGAAVLASTRTLKFGTCVMVLPNRANPLIIAKAASTLAGIGNDRFVLGVGIGWMKEEYAVAGIDFTTRAARMSEMIGILRKLWGPSPVEHHGRFFDFPPTYALPAPRRAIPIYIGAVAPPALRRAGRIGDGWMGMTSTLESLPAQIALIDQGRREAGREAAPFELMVGLARRGDGTLPEAEDYRRAAEMGITQHHVGPIEHILGKVRVTFEEKKRFVREFAERVIHS
jgi:probable F420-dependent oxidoreductase